MTETVLLTIAGVAFLATMVPIPFAAWYAVQDYYQWRADRPGTDLVLFLPDHMRDERDALTDSITVVPADPQLQLH